MLLALMILAATTLAVLFTMTGSVVLAIKSLVMNLLTLSAAFGMLVLIFQDGRLQSLLGYTATGSLEQTNMIILFIIAFGLSTDYGVFLLARIKEAHDSGRDRRGRGRHRARAQRPRGQRGRAAVLRGRRARSRCRASPR